MKLLLVIILTIIVLIPNYSAATEEEVRPSSIFQTEDEKERYQGGLSLDFGFGYGFSYGNSVGFAYLIPEQQPDLETYLERLELELSESTITTRLTLTYSISDRFGMYLVVPSGLVEKKPEVPLPGLIEIEYGLGDIGTGFYYNILTENKESPHVTINFDYQSDNAEFSSLGDGVNNIIAGISLRKYIREDVFLLGGLDYGKRGEKNDVDVGDVFGAGAGLGFLISAGESKLTFNIRYTTVEESSLENRTLIEGYNDLSLTVGVYSLLAGSSMSLYVTRLNDFEFKQSTYGFNWSFNLF